MSEQNEPRYTVTEKISFSTEPPKGQAAPEPQAEPRSQQSTYASYERAGNAARNQAMNAKRTATAWFEGVAPGHGNAVFFGLVGLLVAIVILWVGFFQALLIAILVICGVSFGQWLDGKPTVFDAIRRMFKG